MVIGPVVIGGSFASVAASQSVAPGAADRLRRSANWISRIAPAPNKNARPASQGQLTDDWPVPSSVAEWVCQAVGAGKSLVAVASVWAGAGVLVTIACAATDPVGRGAAGRDACTGFGLPVAEPAWAEIGGRVLARAAGTRAGGEGFALGGGLLALAAGAPLA